MELQWYKQSHTSQSQNHKRAAGHMSNEGTNDNRIYKYKHTEIPILQVKVHIDHYKVSLNFIWFKQKHHLETDYH